ncbi:hypothetical protein GGE16_004440 [Rhizobium leguminosarum]|uniref:Uncharacterized protein n=1 Tax=Rhizobium leguminosarum TaxID=384 RepID=A0AAE2SXX9_RHILE|nr:hypothetical protein [Rhizobium leguminosarum]MBB4434688.1 hypothetical protein [Rhizobium esperanzae]MBB4298600.1 hypothetical protein [Rhizobium leguminosarum]MBB4310426.1 hypothetical protein [Rhizobium leguminosarum]MBB4531584.1 hypothetical protein [Rhizobium leguminosarum]
MLHKNLIAGEWGGGDTSGERRSAATAKYLSSWRRS